MSERVIEVALATLEPQPHCDSAGKPATPRAAAAAANGGAGPAAAQQQPAAAAAAGGGGKRGAARRPALPTVVSGIQLDETYDAIAHFSGMTREWAAAALEQAPRFLLLDFR